MGRLPHALPSDVQSREVDVDARFGPRDWPGPKRGEGSTFGRVRRGQQFHSRILDLASQLPSAGLPDLLKAIRQVESYREPRCSQL